MGGAGSVTIGACSSGSTVAGRQQMTNSCGRVLTEPVVELVSVHGLGRQEVSVVVVGVIQAARVPTTVYRIQC
jgi:hypothetical protein